MKNKLVNLEQLEKVLDSHGEEVSHISVAKDTMFGNQTENRAEQTISGSKFGKFKSGEALLEAYNNLQSDYTKKCQALAELKQEKSQLTLNGEKSLSLNENQMGTNENQMGTNENSILKMQENANSGEENKDLVLNDFLTKEQQLNKNSETEKFETNKSLTEENLGATNLQNTKEFLSYAKKFFEQNPTASDFKNQLFDLVKLDKGDNPLEDAWKEFASKNYFDFKKVLSNPEFLQKYVYDNEQIKTKILNDYFSSIQSFSSPTLIANQKGNQTVLSPYEKPKTLKEAGKIASELLDN